MDRSAAFAGFLGQAQAEYPIGHAELELVHPASDDRARVPVSTLRLLTKTLSVTLES